MRFSKYLLPTLKENPVGAEIVSHRLMLRAGLIRQASAGIYSWLPFGLKALQNITNIVREEQCKAGAIEVLMPTIQSADLWKKSGRYEEYGKEMLRIQDRKKNELLYGPTNEEQITDIMRHAAQSYKDLPRNLFHIQWKFRDEIRPRFGVMRGREFLMKDAYSFDINVEEGKKAYQKMFLAYLRTFEKLGLRALPMIANTGPIGGDLSHEFIILAKTGESAVYCDKRLTEISALQEEVSYESDLSPIIDQYTQFYAATDEQHDKALFDKQVPKKYQIETRGIEVGHIFFFGDKYSKALQCMIANDKGEQVPLQCGSYGIGVSRLVGAVIEASHDEDGIIWPWQLAPFHVGIINLKRGESQCDAVSEKLYQALQKNIEVLYDDRDERAGTKFSDMDLIGLPWQAIIGPRNAKEEMIEIKNRATGERKEVKFAEAVSLLSSPPAREMP